MGRRAYRPRVRRRAPAPSLDDLHALVQAGGAHEARAAGPVHHLVGVLAGSTHAMSTPISSQVGSHRRAASSLTSCEPRGRQVLDGRDQRVCGNRRRGPTALGGGGSLAEVEADGGAVPSRGAGNVPTFRDPLTANRPGTRPFTAERPSAPTSVRDRRTGEERDLAHSGTGAQVEEPVGLGIRPHPGPQRAVDARAVGRIRPV